MRRWLREVWLSPGVLTGAMVCYLLFAAMPQLIYYANGGIGRYTEAWKFGVIPLAIIAGIYSAFRVVGFHPIYRPHYLSWLRQTPWRPGKPLPEGPLSLVMQDVVFVAILTGLAGLHQAAYAYVIPVCFVAARIALWFVSFLRTAHLKHAYLTLLVFSGVIPFHDSPAGLLVVLAVLYAITLYGIRSTLIRFDDWSGRNEQSMSSLTKSKGKNEKLLGWPYDRLAPQLSEKPGLLRESVAISFLITWWAFLAVACLWPHEPATLVLACAVAVLVAFIRSMIYLAGCAAPLSLRGRLVTGQLIIPGYDIVWLAPGSMLLLAGAVFLSSLSPPLPFSVCVAVIVFGSLMITLECPPDIDEWKLTGKHHVVPGIVLSASELVQTQ